MKGILTGVKISVIAGCFLDSAKNNIWPNALGTRSDVYRDSS